MLHKSSAPELQLKVVQRNYESISSLMHSKQQECDKLSLELEGARSQLQDAASMHQQALTRAGDAETQIKVLESKLQDEAQLQKSLRRASLGAAAAAQQQTALKQHVMLLSDKLEIKTQESRRISKEFEGAVAVQDAGMQTLEALRVQYDALKSLAGNTQAQLQSTKAQLQHAESASLLAQQQIMQAESDGKAHQHTAQVAEEQCRQLRQQFEEQKVMCISLETALQASKVQDDLMASQLRVAQHLLQCEKVETQALSQQVLSYQSDVLSHKQQSKRLQDDNQRLQNQMLATGERLEKMSHDSSLDLKKEMLKLQRQLASEEKRSSEDRARADLQCQQLQQQVHTLQVQLQGAQGQVAEAHRLRLEALVAADSAIEHACHKLDVLDPRLQRSISQAEKGVHAVLEEASHSCNHWTQLSESVEQQVTGLNGSIEVLRVTALAQKQKGEAGKPALALLERTVADLQAQLAGEQKSHRLTQEAMARQAPSYAAHIAQIRQQAVEETAAERDRLQGQLHRVGAEMKRLQSCCEADRQATKDLMEVEKIQFTRQLERAQVAQLQLKQELASQQVQAQLRIAQVGEAAHKDLAQLTQSSEMLTAAHTHLASNIRQALEVAEGIADDTNALEHHLRKVGAVETAHSPAPTAAADHPLTDGERADFLVKLMSHARLHLLYLAEKLQEQTVAPEGAVAGSYGQTQSQGPSQIQALSLSQQEKELRATVSKLVHTEQAQEALYTCMACVTLLKNPVVCTPCGHTFCYGCLTKAKAGGELVCPECNNLPITGYVDNRNLEGLVTKYEYRMGALRSLQRMLK